MRYPNRVMKNIALSADEHLIQAARRQAKQRHTTLNAEFRRWLEQYAASHDSEEKRVQSYRSLMDDLADVSSGGKTFSRDQLNKR